ncbi:unnamed protein product [Clonostachys rosea f. rosea IK726]|uniref:Uncharacterized protein n=1 Tax=Clonostachys rosea f. rosea IK726 TaxID=1349383 RepID=A0ACA9U158_BIOOC|nr:unnamed protein product [Clonostachys rosea f. rosea IK726]
MAIYLQDNRTSPPKNLIQEFAASDPPPNLPSEPSFGLDSILGLCLSSFATPLYLYASLKGKFQVWDDLLASMPDEVFHGPALDVGCGRGLVLLKVAERKQKLARGASGGSICPAYGIDIFSKADQTGNSPLATYQNAAAMGLSANTVLHRASFTEQLPFADGVFSLVTSNLAIHNVNREGQTVAIKEMARVCKPGGRVVIIDLFGHFNYHKAVLLELEWREVKIELVGFRMLYGVLPCQILTTTKPPN